MGTFMREPHDAVPDGHFSGDVSLARSRLGAQNVAAQGRYPFLAQTPRTQACFPKPSPQWAFFEGRGMSCCIAIPALLTTARVRAFARFDPITPFDLARSPGRRTFRRAQPLLEADGAPLGNHSRLRSIVQSALIQDSATAATVHKTNLTLLLRTIFNALRPITKDI